MPRGGAVWVLFFDGLVRAAFDATWTGPSPRGRQGQIADLFEGMGEKLRHACALRATPSRET